MNLCFFCGISGDMQWDGMDVEFLSLVVMGYIQGV